MVCLMSSNFTLFNFSRANRLSWTQIFSDYDHSLVVGRWLNGRLCGWYVSVYVPYFWKKAHHAD